MIRVAMMPVNLHFCIVSALLPGIDHLLFCKFGAFAQAVQVNDESVPLNGQDIEIQGPWCRGFQHITGLVKDRGMTRAFKLLSFSNPGNSTAQVGASFGKCKKSAVVQAAEIEMSPSDIGDGSRREIGNSTGIKQGLFFRCVCLSSGEKIEHRTCQHLEQGSNAQAYPDSGEKISPRSTLITLRPTAAIA